MKLTGAAILISRGMKVLQAAPAAYPYRSVVHLPQGFVHERRGGRGGLAARDVPGLAEGDRR
jgi:hypothetical protein